MNDFVKNCIEAQARLDQAKSELEKSKILLGEHFAKIRKEKGFSQRKLELELYARGFQKYCAVQRIERPKKGNTYSTDTIAEALKILKSI